MTDRAKKITELDALTAPALVDLLIIEDDPSGSPVTKKITVNNLLNSGLISANAYTPATTTVPGVIKVGDQLSINATGFLNTNLNVANTTAHGTIKVGDQLSVNAIGFLNTNLNVANTIASGTIKVGNQLSVNATGFLNTNLNVANTTASGTIKVGENLSINATGFLNGTVIAIPSGVQRVITEGNTEITNTSVKFVFANPGLAGNNINIQLPNTGITDGREFTVKNINANGFVTTIQSIGISIDVGSVTLGSPYTLTNTNDSASWVWDNQAATYRLIAYSNTGGV